MIIQKAAMFILLVSLLMKLLVVNKNAIFNEVVKKDNRPETLPKIHRNLIERCWSQERNNQPYFEEIAEHLKSDINFITEKIKRENYFNYIEFIDKSCKAFDSKKKILDLSEFIQSKSKINEETGSIIDKNKTKSNEKSDEPESESAERKFEEEVVERKAEEEAVEGKIEELETRMI